MQKKTLIYGLFAYTVLLPYLCRLYRGLDWTLQYLPIGQFGNLFTELIFAIPAVLFFGVFSALTAIPMILCIRYWQYVPVTFYICLVTTTGLLIYYHHDYDLAADAQAAVGLVFIPLYTVGITMAIAVLPCLIEVLIRKRRTPNQAPEDTARKLADPQH